MQVPVLAHVTCPVVTLRVGVNIYVCPSKPFTAAARLVEVIVAPTAVAVMTPFVVLRVAKFPTAAVTLAGMP